MNAFSEVRDRRSEVEDQRSEIGGLEDRRERPSVVRHRSSNSARRLADRWRGQALRAWHGRSVDFSGNIR